MGTAREIAVREVRDHWDLLACFRLRYEAFCAGEGGAADYPGACHHSKLVVDELDALSAIFGAWQQDTAEPTLVATMRITSGDKAVPAWARQWATELLPASPASHGAVFFSNLVAVARQARGSSVLLRLFSYAYRLALARGAELDIIYCRPAHEELYRKLGYDPVRTGCLDGLGERTVMAFPLRDAERLAARGSPFLPLLLRHLRCEDSVAPSGRQPERRRSHTPARLAEI